MAETTIYRDAQGRTDAERACDKGVDYPYDGHRPEKDWAHKAARGVLYDLSDRGGIKHGLRDVDREVREDIVDALADIIREADRRRGDLPCVLTDVYDYITVDRDSLDEAGCPDGVEEADALLRRIEPLLPRPR